MNKIKSAIAVVALAAAAGGVALATAGSAAAYGTPSPWASGSLSDPNASGGIQFFDSSGNVITSGSTNASPFAAYMVGLTTLRAGDTRSVIAFYTPQTTSQDSWTTNQNVGVTGTYPITTAPAPINGSTLPARANQSSDATLDSLATNIPQTLTGTGYVNTYELRLYTNHSGGVQTTTYDYADITINTSTHQWVETWSPNSGIATTGHLTSSLDSPGNANTGSAITLTDTLSPTAAPGTVQFFDNSTAIGSPVTVSSGVATVPTTVQVDGANAYTAVYTPTTLSGYAGNTSNTDTITGNHVIASTSVAIGESATTGTAGTPVTFTGTVSPSTAPGSVNFYNSGSQIGSGTVSGGVATFTTNSLAVGTYTITAQYMSSDTANFSNSPMSTSVTYTVTPPACTTCSDTQNIQTSVGAGSISITTPYTASNPLVLPQMVLNASGTMLSTSAPFGTASSSIAPNGSNSIYVVDTRAADTGWTVSASSNNLTGVASSSHIINSQNVGLTGLTAVPVAGNALTAASVGFTNVPAANPAVLPAASGTQGLGGGINHQIAQTTGFGTTSGDGTIGIVGTLTINAPTSTVADTYNGTVTFTIA